MKIYIKDEMIIDTEQVSCFKVLKKTKYDFQLIAFCGGEAKNYRFLTVVFL